MKNWESNKFTTTVREGVEVQATFKYLGTKSISRINKSCSCTGFKWEDPETLKVLVSTSFVKSNVHPKMYEAGQRSYEKNASLTVVYDDGTTEDLVVEATVVEPERSTINE